MSTVRYALPVLLLLAAGLAASGAPAGASTVLIQPGDSYNGICTLNFVFDGEGTRAGKVYVGTAAHCVRQMGEAARTTGYPEFGRVVYMGDVGASVNGGAARENGIPGEQLDFALIEVHPQYHGVVVADVVGRPGMPQGGFTTPRETPTGDLILISGYGTGFATVSATRENRVGVLYTTTARQWVAEAPITPGDSGGPILHESGKALGVVSGTTFGVQMPPVKWHGPTVDGILAEMESIGWSIRLREA